jgi:hypothetical protein
LFEFPNCTFRTSEKKDPRLLSAQSDKLFEYPEYGNDDWFSNQMAVILESHHEFSKSDNILSLMDDNLKEKPTNSYGIFCFIRH